MNILRNRPQPAPLAVELMQTGTRRMEQLFAEYERRTPKETLRQAVHFYCEA